jgi:phospholipid/cholesterol/gamma-HCH transport system substrate-binding protein
LLSKIDFKLTHCLEQRIFDGLGILCYPQPIFAGLASPVAANRHPDRSGDTGETVPSQREVRWSQLKVGVLVLVAICALIALIFLMTGTGGSIFTRRIVVHSFFNNAAGVKAGAPVTLQGVTIGSVSKVLINPRHKDTPVEVIMKLGTDYQNDLHTDSIASLTTAGLLGNTFIDIDSSHATGSPLKNGDELPVHQAPSLSDVIKSSQGTIQQVNDILAKVNAITDEVQSGQGTIGKFLKDPALYNHAVKTIAQAQTLIQGINNGRGSLGKLVTDDTLYNHANQTVSQLQAVVGGINEGKGTVGKLVKDPALYNNLNRVVAGIDQGRGTLGMLARDEAFRKKVGLTVTDLHTMLNGVNQGNGTVGKLMKDPTLYNNSNSMIVEMRSLLKAIRKNPKKYLTIHFKLF